MSKIGLKLLSTGCEKYCDGAISLFREHIFDYIELYIVPDTTSTIEQWKNFQKLNKPDSPVKIPFILHAPDHKNNISLSTHDNLEHNIEIYKQVDQFKQELNAKCIIVTPGTRGVISETARQLKIINAKNIIIKNNIHRISSLNNAAGIGSNMEEIEKLKKELNCGFCLDIDNAICTANLISVSPYELLRQFSTFNPIMYRISGNNITATQNEHLHFEETQINYSIISMNIKNNALITINSDNSDSPDLNAFKEDVKFIRRFCK